MRIHDLKIMDEFADDVYSGEKPFEIRENDRGYQKGDRINFKVISADSFKDCSKHPLNDIQFEITYVLSGWGLENGFVALGIKEVSIYQKKYKDSL